MLVVIHLVRGLDCAPRIEQLLKDEGFLVRLRPVYKALCDAENYFEIKVLESELEEAREFLVSHGLM